jgi:hypothetical protein
LLLHPVAPAPRTTNVPKRKLKQQLPPIKKRKKKRKKKGRICKGKEERGERKSPKECEGSGWDTDVWTSDSENNADPTFANPTSANPTDTPPPLVRQDSMLSRYFFLYIYTHTHTQHFLATLNSTLISVDGILNNAYGPYPFTYRVMLVLGMLVLILVLRVMML